MMPGNPMDFSHRNGDYYLLLGQSTSRVRQRVTMEDLRVSVAATNMNLGEYSRSTSASSTRYGLLSRQDVRLAKQLGDQTWSSMKKD